MRQFMTSVGLLDPTTGKVSTGVPAAGFNYQGDGGGDGSGAAASPIEQKAQTPAGAVQPPGLLGTVTGLVHAHPLALAGVGVGLFVVLGRGGHRRGGLF